MRRSVVLALATAAATTTVLAVGAPPASAHICPSPAVIPVAQEATINVGVTVEDATVPDVEVTVPNGLRLDRVDAKAGWTFTRSGATVRFRGGPITRFRCEFFSLGVTAPAEGSFGIEVIQRNTAGAVVARSIPDPSSPSSRNLDQFVYAGVKPPSPASSGGPSAVVIAGIVLVGLGATMALVLTIRSRRAGDDSDEDDDAEGEHDEGVRDAELQARLDRFRKRKPDSRPPA